MSLTALVEHIDEQLDLALQQQPADLPGSALAELVETIDQALVKSTALLMRSSAAYDASGEWEVEGHRSASDAIKLQRHRSAKHARSLVQLGRALRTMPHTDLAFGAGAITEEHVRVLVGANKAHLPFDEAEELLVGYAEELTFRDFVRAVKYWEQVASREAADDEADQKEQRRECHSSRTLDGMGKVDAWLEPIGYSEFHLELKRLEKLEFEADWAEGVRLHGPSVSLDQLPRTSAQRRADALVEMARRSSGAQNPTYARPTVNLHGDVETFMAVLNQNLGLPFDFPVERTCELDDGTAVTPQQLFEQAVRGHVRRVVWESPGVILDFGRKQRLYTGALREALCVRDRICRHQSCELPAIDCEADHIIEWDDTGPTSIGNGRMLCSYHHRKQRRTIPVHSYASAA